MINIDIVCFSHLRWNFVYQRPQHLLSRFAKNARVFFVEEPMFGGDEITYTTEDADDENVTVIVPRLPHGLSAADGLDGLKTIVRDVMNEMQVTNFISWYYSPMALAWTEQLNPALTVYDCMDELSAFKFAPPELKETEAKLMAKADLIFTGGYNLYESKRKLHNNVYPFPSSIDKEHFMKARAPQADPPDQEKIPYPRLGYYGVIDERIDLELISEIARQQPSWHFIFIGPVVKIDPNTLPRNQNIHYLGSKDYKDLPKYLSGWNITLMPFALNESTEFISPTKTPEYLAGGKPVISTAIKDVVNTYGKQQLVHIIGNAEEALAAAQKELHNKQREIWLGKVDAFLAGMSWEKTFNAMDELMVLSLSSKQQSLTNQKAEAYV
ncbi:MAG: glycosyltransferase family 1 protein [Gemmatimonadaceae bacterium]|nr:glycosyltransferase family 1 protein [Chitinophagaceae bacterium]